MLYKQTVLLTGITFLGLTGYAMRLEQLYYMAALLALLAVGSYLLCVLSVRGLHVERGSARKIYEGESCDLRLSLSNQSHLPKAFIAVEDTLPQWLEAASTPPAAIATDRPGEAAAAARFTIPMLLPHHSVELTYRARGAKRGVFTLGPVVVSATDALGAFSISREMRAPQEIIVYPSSVRLLPEALAGVRSFGGIETEQLSAAGAGLEFYGIRDYRPGDALRRIHWPSTARLGDFAVVEFEESFGADMLLVLDLRSGTEFGSGKDTTLETAIRAAASLATFTVENGAVVTVVGHDARGRHLTSARRPDELPAVLEALARMAADGDTPPARVMAGVNGMVAGTTAVILTTAADETVAMAAEAWARQRAQPVAVLFDAASWGAENAPDLYTAAKHMEAAGARVEIFRRDDNLQRLLGRAVSDAA